MCGDNTIDVNNDPLCSHMQEHGKYYITGTFAYGEQFHRYGMTMKPEDNPTPLAPQPHHYIILFYLEGKMEFSFCSYLGYNHQFRNSISVFHHVKQDFCTKQWFSGHYDTIIITCSTQLASLTFISWLDQTVIITFLRYLEFFQCQRLNIYRRKIKTIRTVIILLARKCYNVSTVHINKHQ